MAHQEPNHKSKMMQGKVLTSKDFKSTNTKRQTLNYGQTISNRDLFGKVTSYTAGKQWNMWLQR